VRALALLWLPGCIFITPDDECARASSLGEPEPRHCRDWWDTGWWDTGWWDTGDTSDTSAPDTGETWTDTGDFQPAALCVSWRLDLVGGQLSPHNGSDASVLDAVLVPEGWDPSAAPDTKSTCALRYTVTSLTDRSEIATAPQVRVVWDLRFSQAPQPSGICDQYAGDAAADLGQTWRIALRSLTDEEARARTALGEDTTGLFIGQLGLRAEVPADSALGHIHDINLSGEAVALPASGTLPTGRYTAGPLSCRDWPLAD